MKTRAFNLIDNISVWMSVCLTDWLWVYTNRKSTSKINHFSLYNIFHFTFEKNRPKIKSYCMLLCCIIFHRSAAWKSTNETISVLLSFVVVVRNATIQFLSLCKPVHALTLGSLCFFFYSVSFDCRLVTICWMDEMFFFSFTKRQRQLTFQIEKCMTIARSA